MMGPQITRARRGSTHVATTEPAVKLTYEDYCAAPADERYELLDGELIMVPAPNTKHQQVQFRLIQSLGRFILDHKLGEMLCAPYDVLLSDNDVVQPDMLFIAREREHLLITKRNTQGAPDLAVEILSPGTAHKDRGYKKTIYGRHGVTEYWIVDPVAETVEIHRRQGERLVLTRTFGRNETLRSELFPGLEIDLDDVFPDDVFPN